MQRVRDLLSPHRGMLSVAALLAVVALAGAMVVSAVGLMASAGTAGPEVPPVLTARPDAGPSPDQPPRTPPVAVPTAVPEPDHTTVATAAIPDVDVYDAAGGAPTPARVLRAGDQLSGQLVFVVRGRDGEWLDVLLPARPNGATGWIRAADVTTSSHPYRVEVRLGAHRLFVRNGPELVLEAPVGVGTNDAPTPGGDYFLKELIRPPDPAGAYGPYAYGLSGFSDVFTDYAGGAGVIGIHGTDRPETVGTDVSDGCLRVTDDVVTRMVEEIGLPLGTPVTIVP